MRNYQPLRVRISYDVNGYVLHAFRGNAELMAIGMGVAIGPENSATLRAAIRDLSANLAYNRTETEINISVTVKEVDALATVAFMTMTGIKLGVHEHLVNLLRKLQPDHPTLLHIDRITKTR